MAIEGCGPGQPESLIGMGGGGPTSDGGSTGDGGSGGLPFNSGDGGMGGHHCSTQVTCADMGADCGPISDGCNGVLECGECSEPETCGGSGTANVCGQFVCQAQTCADLGANCGPVGDGCGEVLECGSCSLPERCGGDGSTPSVCSVPSWCTNLCLQQLDCPVGTTTSVSGKVYAPGRGNAPGDPLLNALVYVPNAQVDAFTPGVSCETCEASVSGSPLVSATTGADGSFVLENVPVGQDIPLVIQLGRWRRQVTIPAVTACQDNPIGWELTRLPRNKSEGDIPKMAIVTGAVDELECVLRKIGIEDAEFTQPSGDGRVHMFMGMGAPGSSRGAGTPNESTLWGDQATLDQYDMLLFPCQGNEYYTQRAPAASWAAMWDRVKAYTAAGGRIFSTHYSYVWLTGKPSIGTGPGPWESVATWNVNQSSLSNQDGVINTTFPKGEAFAQWLLNVGASSVLGAMPVNVVRHDTDAVTSAQLWMSASNPAGVPLHFTFNTPIDETPENQCGRVVFSDFHVSNANNGGTTFPNECSNGAMTPQEKLVEFMLFDLASCVTSDTPTCNAQSCDDQGIECGPTGDGCGELLQCGECDEGETCGGGGMPGVCGNLSCDPRTCDELNVECGPMGDGCGGLLQCGTCDPPQSCGGGGTPGKCGGGGPA
jgi:hypothetical protein